MLEKDKNIFTLFERDSFWPVRTKSICSLSIRLAIAIVKNQWIELAMNMALLYWRI